MHLKRTALPCDHPQVLFAGYTIVLLKVTIISPVYKDRTKTGKWTPPVLPVSLTTILAIARAFLNLRSPSPWSTSALKTAGICRWRKRWIVRYNFCINDQRWGRMFVRISPHLPFQHVYASGAGLTSGWCQAKLELTNASSQHRKILDSWYDRAPFGRSQQKRADLSFIVGACRGDFASVVDATDIGYLPAQR